MPYTTHFAPGPPLHHPTLGLLPGPPVALVPTDPSAPVLLVDDRNAGQDISHGRHRARTITTAEALALLAEPSRRPAPTPAAPADPPVTSLRQAAALLRVGRSTLSRRLAALPPAARPANTGSADRPRWWWPSAAACRAWWQQVNQQAPDTTPASPILGAPSASPTPPPAEPPADTPSLVERLAALQATFTD